MGSKVYREGFPESEGWSFSWLCVALSDFELQGFATGSNERSRVQSQSVRHVGRVRRVGRRAEWNEGAFRFGTKSFRFVPLGSGRPCSQESLKAGHRTGMQFLY